MNWSFRYDLICILFDVINRTFMKREKLWIFVLINRLRLSLRGKDEMIVKEPFMLRYLLSIVRRLIFWYLHNFCDLSLMNILGNDLFEHVCLVSLNLMLLDIIWNQRRKSRLFSLLRLNILQFESWNQRFWYILHLYWRGCRLLRSRLIIIPLLYLPLRTCIILQNLHLLHQHVWIQTCFPRRLFYDFLWYLVFRPKLHET